MGQLTRQRLLWSFADQEKSPFKIPIPIDYFFVSKEMRKNLKGAAIPPEVMGSDHCPVSVTLGF